jgi:hypothetical protein
MAVFSAGLFGVADDPAIVDPVKHPYDGFFDNTARAGFFAEEAAATKNTISSTGTMPSVSTYEKLFGSKWLPSVYEPKGIFYDFDNNPATDDRLVAWWGDNPNTAAEDYMWLKGVADNYAPLTAAELQTYATSSEPYYVGGIEDVLNLGLTYMIDVGDMSGQTSFTLRMIPVEDETRVNFVPGFTEEANQPPTDLTIYESASSGGSSASVMDNTGMLVSILAFLGLGGLLVRRKLAK